MPLHWKDKIPQSNPCRLVHLNTAIEYEMLCHSRLLRVMRSASLLQSYSKAAIRYKAFMTHLQPAFELLLGRPNISWDSGRVERVGRIDHPTPYLQ